MSKVQDETLDKSDLELYVELQLSGPLVGKFGPMNSFI